MKRNEEKRSTKSSKLLMNAEMKSQQDTRNTQFFFSFLFPNSQYNDCPNR